MKDLFYRVEEENKKIFYKLYIHKIGAFKFNWHREIEVNIVLKGKVEFCVEGKKYLLKKDDFIIINPNSGHATLSNEKDTIVMVLHIDPIYFNDQFDKYENIKFKNNIKTAKENDERCNAIKYLLACLIKELKKDDNRNKIKEITIFNIIITNIIEVFSPFIDEEATSKKSKANIKTISKVLKYIEDRHHEKISLKNIADIMGYNESYVSQFFKNNIGINYYEYLTRVRIREATFKLITTNKTIADIALDHGFSDIKAFNKSFKENFGRTPKQYRREINKYNDENIFSVGRVFVKDDNKDIIKKLEEYEQLLDDNILFMNKYNKNNVKKINDEINYEIRISELEKELNETKEKLQTIKAILD